MALPLPTKATPVRVATEPAKVERDPGSRQLTIVAGLIVQAPAVAEGSSVAKSSMML